MWYGRPTATAELSSFEGAEFLRPTLQDHATLYASTQSSASRLGSSIGRRPNARGYSLSATDAPCV